MKDDILKELDQSVVSFKQTVGALKEIEKINQELRLVADELADNQTVTEKQYKKLIELHVELNSLFGDMQQSLTGYIDDIKDLHADQAAELNEITSDIKTAHKETVTSIRNIVESKTVTVERTVQNAVQEIKQTTDAALGELQTSNEAILEKTDKILQSVSDLQNQTSGSAKEIRDKLVETDTRIHMDLENRFKKIDELSIELALLQKQQKKAQIMAVIGGIGAIVAAVASVLHFFI